MFTVIPILILVAFSALFSSTETAFACVNKIRLKHMADSGDKRAVHALDIANRYEQALTAILVGNNVVNIGASSLATIFFTEHFGSAGAAISTIVMTILVLTFGEVLPKSYAKSHADKLALALGGILSKFTRLMTPFVVLFGLLSRAFKPKEEAPSVTEDELKYIIDEIEEEGVLEEQESDLVISALQFDETSVSQILIPRVQIVALPADATIADAQKLFLDNHFSRFPIYEKDMDNIIGMITNKDFFRLICGQYHSLSDIIQNVIYVPETKRISDILRDMQHAKTHLAIVVDQYGGTKGMVTLEDIIEQLVGDIYDESDEVVHEFQKTAPHTYTIAGSFSISDVCAALEECDAPPQIPETDSTTVGGWIMELLGHIPESGETADWENFHFTVLAAENQAVKTVRLKVTPPESEDAKTNA
ncbi:hemolysin family protein [uncultured Ruminococcus sp.]|uniref:hemolysin family protein n=1 Tax=uncultured Ruminococcus sp. TaxID=165186 RepID=UPI0025ED0219|nr:hemolysin family protein [uncultured Ruminococcus sp.]